MSFNTPVSFGKPLILKDEITLYLGIASLILTQSTIEQ